jgi:NADH-quinone oxidoreductase subunit L
MGMGVGAYGAALFHLLTHAFFKAGLFLSAGAVIHALHALEHQYHTIFNPQDMRLMGGLRRKMPVTFACYLICGLSLAGLPLFSGFLSKDAILLGALDWADAQANFLAYAIPDLGFLTALLTAAYVGRQLILVFGGNFRLEQWNARFAGAGQTVREVPAGMYGPMMLLALLSLFFFFSLNPLDAGKGWFLAGMPGAAEVASANHGFTLLTSGVLVLAGLGMALFFTNRSRRPVPAWLRNLSLRNWYLDELYGRLFVHPLRLTMRAARRLDARYIDRLVKYTAIAGVVFAHILAWVDRTFVDGAVRLVGFLSGRTGQLARSFGAGNAQWYLASALAGLIILIVWVLL